MKTSPKKSIIYRDIDIIRNEYVSSFNFIGMKWLCWQLHIEFKNWKLWGRADVFTAVIIVPVVTYMVQWHTCKYEFKVLVHCIVLNSDLYSVIHIYLKPIIAFYLRMFCPQNSVLVKFFYICPIHCYGDTREFDFSSWWPLCHVAHGCINGS